MARLRAWAPALLIAVTAFLLSHWIDSRWGQQEDAYITYQYARRLAAGAGFTFSPGAPPTYGTTTPLWTLILALACRLGAAPHIAAPWISSALHAASAALLFVSVRRLGRTMAGAVAGLGWATALAVFFRVGGMETPLVVTLMLMTWLALLEGWQPWAAGVCAGLLLLTRPDTVLFVAAAGAAVRRSGRWWVLGLPVVMYLPWALYAWHTFGDIVPLSIRAKAAAGVLLRRASLEDALRMYFPLSCGAAVGGACGVLAGLGAARVWRERPALRAVLVWLPGYALAMWVVPYPGFAWYYVPLLPFGLALVALGLAPLAPRMAPRAALAVGLLGGLLWCGWTGTRVLPWPDVHAQLAQAVRQRARPGDVVAAQEVGALAYWSELPVLDLCGLNSPEALPYAHMGRYSALIRAQRPRFVMTVGIAGPWAEDYEQVVSLPYWGRTMRYSVWERKESAAAARPRGAEPQLPRTAMAPPNGH